MGWPWMSHIPPPPDPGLHGKATRPTQARRPSRRVSTKNRLNVTSEGPSSRRIRFSRRHHPSPSRTTARRSIGESPAHATKTCNVTVIIRYSSTRSTSASTGTAHLASAHVLATASHP